ncbi:MAG: nucleoside/nucleotide kinase family protein [Vannielia sp.]|uniref:nucleoside/nucleotide kinase family protein n=1 Tax=Vannielia sp. TaxID=2813045 RepID=UPI003B8E2853
MTPSVTSLPELRQAVLNAPMERRRRVVALAGAPASGKSTLATTLCDALNESGQRAQVVPMDGFHLHNPILVERGLLARKGAPETFDVAGFLHLVGRLGDEPEIVFPVFDRTRDIAIAGAGIVDEACETVIVEGNYLLLDRPLWRDLRQHMDLSVLVAVEIEILRARLVARWLEHGLSPAEATARAEGNDLANAELIAQASLPADVIWTGGEGTTEKPV